MLKVIEPPGAIALQPDQEPLFTLVLYLNTSTIRSSVAFIVTETLVLQLALFGENEALGTPPSATDVLTARL